MVIIKEMPNKTAKREGTTTFKPSLENCFIAKILSLRAFAGMVFDIADISPAGKTTRTESNKKQEIYGISKRLYSCSHCSEKYAKGQYIFRIYTGLFANAATALLHGNHAGAGHLGNAVRLQHI